MGHEFNTMLMHQFMRRELMHEITVCDLRLNSHCTHTHEIAPRSLAITYQIGLHMTSHTPLKQFPLRGIAHVSECSPRCTRDAPHHPHHHTTRSTTAPHIVHRSIDPINPSMHTHAMPIRSSTHRSDHSCTHMPYPSHPAQIDPIMHARPRPILPPAVHPAQCPRA